MADPFGMMVLPIMHTRELRHQVEVHAAWALTPDYTTKYQSRQFWYVSAVKQEPRLGDRYDEPGAELESPLDIGRRIKAMYQDLPEYSVTVVEFLEKHPDHALAATRVAAAAKLDMSNKDALWLWVDSATPRVKQPAFRVQGCEGFVAIMSKLAERTFVPESTQSRIAGAGAGLTDNH